MTPQIEIKGGRRSDELDQIRWQTVLKLIAICWAGLFPIGFPAWLIVKAEMMELNRIQDERNVVHFVSREEYVEFKNAVGELKAEVQRLRETLDRRMEMINGAAKPK